MAVARAIAERFRESTSRDVEEMQDVAFADRIVPKKPARLVPVLGFPSDVA
jgi:hypothetical protein